MERTNIHSVESEYPLPGTALTCLNGLKHGGTSRQLFLTGEHPQEFYKLLAESFENHKPVTTEDSALVTDAVLARWYLWRRQRAHAKREFEIFEAATESDSPGVEGLKELALFDRYCTHAERALNRALRNLQMFKKSVLDEEKWRTHLTMQKQKFELDLKKFELRQEQNSRSARAAEVKQAKELALENRFNPARVVHHLVKSNGVDAIGQKVFVSTDPQGLVSVTLEPNNDIIANIIQNRHEFMVFRPRHVVRTTYFADGAVPRTYQWTLKNATPDQVASLNDPDVGITTTLSFEFFRSLAAGENSLKQAA